MKYQLAGFDFDGTLADSADWFAERLNKLAPEFKFKPVKPEDRKCMRALDTRQIMKHLEIPMWKLPQIVRRLRNLASEDSAQIPLFAGVEELFDSLRAMGIRIAIVSSNSEVTIRKILGATNSAAVAYYECGASLFGKAIKLRLLLRRAKAKPADMIYIGDEARDAVASKQVGIDFGAVTWGYAAPEALKAHSPKLFFNSLCEIPRHLTV